MKKWTATVTICYASVYLKLEVKRKGGILARNEHFQSLLILIEVEKMKNLLNWANIP